MKLYHGSKNGNIFKIKKQQAGVADGLEVPPDELLNAIYLTPDYGYALAMAARPEGVTNIDTDNKIIKFEHPDLFDPEKEIYIYEIEIPDDEARQIDSLQYVIENREYVAPKQKFIHKAIDIKKYYKLENWYKKEIGKEINQEIKFR